MAGPNDVGVLRGIIGDGQSMNDEQIYEKARGKRPGIGNKDVMHMPTEKKHLVSKNYDSFNATDKINGFLGKNTQQSNYNASEALSRFTGKRNAMPINYTRFIKSDMHSRNDEDTPVEQPTVVVGEGTLTAATKAQEVGSALGKVKNYATKLWTGNQDKAPIVSVSKITSKPKAIFEGAKMAVGSVKSGFYGQQPEVTPEEKLLRQQQVQLKRAQYKNALKETGASFTGGRSGRTLATDLSRTIGENLSSGAIIGPFQQQGASKKLSEAAYPVEAYKDRLYKKYHTKDDAILGSRMSPNEKIQLNKLKTSQISAQRKVARGGFMGKETGGYIARGSVPDVNFNKFTQVGTSQVQPGNYGFSPEPLARLGVGQGLRAISENKFGAVLPPQASQNTDKISMILGKRPDPTGTGESAAAKIKRFSGM